jgi:hypothetical protein
MSKELIEQLANKYGTKIRKFGQRHYTYEFNVDNLEAFAKAYAQTQGKSIPDGYALVPIEPTDAMIDTAETILCADEYSQTRAIAEAIKAAINAAPIESGVKG